MDKANLKPQVNMFRCKRQLAPFQPMKRGFFHAQPGEFRQKIQKKEVKK